MPGRRTFSGLVVLALLAATAVVTWLSYDNERDDAMASDLALVRQAAIDARQSVSGVASGLKGAPGVVDEHGYVGAARFRTFARGVLDRSPFLGLSWAPLIENADRDAFEARLGRPISRFGPHGGVISELRSDSGGYLPLALTYPNTTARRELLGFDSFSEPTRRTTVKAAIRTHEPRLSPPITLAQTEQLGALVYSPVWLSINGEPEVVGVMISGLPGETIAADVGRQLNLEDQISISDSGQALWGPSPGGDSASTKVSVLGRRWTVSIPATASANFGPPILLGLSGLTLTLAAAGMFLLQTRRERDLQRRRRTAELQAARDSLLTRITEVLEREIEVDGRLRSLARTLVPAVGDVCSVHEVTAEGVVRQVGVAALDSRTEALVRSLPEPAPTSPIRSAITSREPVLYTRIAEDREVSRARERGIEQARERGDATPEELLQADQRSNMIVPLVARGRVLGTISLSVLASSGRAPLGREDVAFGMEVATHAAMALDNARLYEQQRDIAAILQQALLPRTLPEVAGAAVAVRHRPGKAGTEVGGDFYDLFEVGDHWMAVVGDVCGKGPEAAALTALVRHTLRATAKLGPREAVLRVHEAIQASGENTYCTLCCAELSRDASGLRARVTTAGHPEPRVIGSHGEVTRLDVTGPLVGVLDNPVFEAQDISLPEGSTFFMCSDGIPEARRNGEIFGDQRLEGLLARLGPLEPDEMLRRLEEEVVSFVAGRPRDDLALFALRVRSKP